MPLSQIKFSRNKKFGRSNSLFCGGWILAHAIAGAVIGALEAGGLQFFATLILSGWIIGFAQWFVLRRWLRLPWWILMSAIGWILGRQVSLLSRPVWDGFIRSLTQLGGWEVLWMNVVTQPIIFLGFGLAQWWLLRLQPQATGWIFASMIGGLASGIVGATFCLLWCAPITTATRSAIPATAIVYSAGWTAYSLITLLPIVNITRRNR